MFRVKRANIAKQLTATMQLHQMDQKRDINYQLIATTMRKLALKKFIDCYNLLQSFFQNILDLATFSTILWPLVYNVKILQELINTEQVWIPDKFNIPVPCDLAESNKPAPLHEEGKQEDQHRHAIIPGIMHRWCPL